MLICASFALGAIIALAGNSNLRWLVAPVLLFFALGVVVLVVVVLRLAQRDPTPLVLGEMSGEEWIAHKRLLMGDSERGDRLEVPPSLGEPVLQAETEDVEPDPPTGLPAGEDDG